MRVDIEVIAAGLFVLAMLAIGAIHVTIAVTGWQPNSHYASSHDDPSPGPNALF